MGRRAALLRRKTTFSQKFLFQTGCHGTEYQHQQEIQQILGLGHGSALIQDWREKTQVAKCKYWHENDVLPVQTAAGLTKTMAPRDSVTLDEYELEIPKSDVHDFYRNFVSAIRGEATQIVTHEQMRRVMTVIEAAFKSDREHRIVNIEEI